MTTVRDFFEELGGIAKVAREMEYPLTTVATWAQKNKIPRWQVRPLKDLAESKNVKAPDWLSERQDAA